MSARREPRRRDGKGTHAALDPKAGTDATPGAGAGAGMADVDRSAGPGTVFDPMKAWREWFVKNERDWSESITRAIKDDAVSRGLGQQFGAALAQQQALAQGMSGVTSAMNLASRDDVAALGERLGQLEDAVARVEAMLVQRAQGSSGASGPPRTRRPPAVAPEAAPAPAKAAGRAAGRAATASAAASAKPRRRA